MYLDHTSSRFKIRVRFFRPQTFASFIPGITVVVAIAGMLACPADDVVIGTEGENIVALLLVPPPTESTLVVVTVLRYVELAGQLLMSGAHAVTVKTSVRVSVDVDAAMEAEDDRLHVDTAVDAEDDRLHVAPAPETVEEGAMGLVKVLNVEREEVASVDVAIDVVAGAEYPSKRSTFAHW